ncbi:FxsB family cyclophane-forming radical SAM/SPASM peptide maturase [Sphaerisporangium sp. NPDC051011]|uniref:FxsB family cyclophane-forming radical SAM/SPASM peptide maturase n=1 Tax=Sphaerisporangium sp. NPDC051011 TaxID=3155792 RepID=UPI0033DDE191
MTTFICKVASRCNLDCDYCYVYRHADQSWRRQPQRMSMRTAAQLGRRINEHAVTHHLREVNVILHGGEPLLLGLPYLRELCDAITEPTKNVTIRWHGQTNGVLYDEATLEFCRERNLSFGLSIDGPAEAHDRHRVDHAGRPSFAGAHRALTLLSGDWGRPVWGGVLAVIDLRHDPLDVYRFLRGFEPPNIDFLLPLGHHDLRPPGKDSPGTTPYADWLLRIFREWYDERPQPIRIRRFRDVVALHLGAQNSSEEWGLQPVDLIVVETNGELQAVDTLKVTFEGACELGLNVFDHSFDDALRSPSVRARQDAWATLSPICQACDLVRVCGGGYFPHRYSDEAGFNNPSVYCADLMKLIREITTVVDQDLARLA